MNSLKSMGVGFASLVLILVVVVGGYNLLALNLGTVSGDYFKGALAVVVLLGGVWLTMQGLGFIGKPFVLGASLMLIVITLSHRVPGVVAFAAQTTRTVDRTAQTAAVNMSMAREIPCNKNTTSLRLFERETGAPLVWLSETEDGRLICYDRPGFHPQTRRTLVAVNEELATRILSQEPYPLPDTTTIPAPAYTPQPVIDLSEGPLTDLSEGPIPR